MYYGSAWKACLQHLWRWFRSYFHAAAAGHQLGSCGCFLAGLQEFLDISGGRGLSGDAPFTTTHVLDDDPGDLTDALAIDRGRRTVSFSISSRFCSGARIPSMALKLISGMPVLLRCDIGHMQNFRED
jgi:hypothetical protein